MLCWLVLAFRETIADVWDETAGLILWSGTEKSVAAVARSSVSESFALYRPLVTLITALVIRLTPSRELAWRLLRGCNVALVLASLVLLQRTVIAWRGRNALRELSLTVLFLFSGSALICAGWYATAFDCWALFFVLLGVWALSGGRCVWAGLCFGLGMFCKETTVLAIPFALALALVGRISWRAALRAVCVTLPFAALYFALRGGLIELGSPDDIHGLHIADLGPTLVTLTESFWRQARKDGVRLDLRLLGFGSLGISLLALPGLLRRAAMVGVVLATAVLYLGDAGYQNGRLLLHENFVGRLYLVPVALVLLLIAVEGRAALLPLLFPVVLLGAWETYGDHIRFQMAYSRIYALASSEPPLTVQYPEKPLVDAVRRLRVGDYASASWRLDAVTGELRRIPHQP